MFTNFPCKAGTVSRKRVCGYAKILLVVSYWANANVKDNVQSVGHYRLLSSLYRSEGGYFVTMAD